MHRCSCRAEWPGVASCGGYRGKRGPFDTSLCPGTSQSPASQCTVSLHGCPVGCVVIWCVLRPCRRVVVSSSQPFSPVRVFVCADRPPELVIQGRSTSGCRHMRQSGVYASKCASSLPAPGQLRCSGAGVVSCLAPDPRVRVAATRPRRVCPWRRPCFLIFKYTLYSKQEAASQKVAPDARTASLKMSQPAHARTGLPPGSRYPGLPASPRPP